MQCKGTLPEIKVRKSHIRNSAQTNILKLHSGFWSSIMLINSRKEYRNKSIKLADKYQFYRVNILLMILVYILWFIVLLTYKCQYFTNYKYVSGALRWVYFRFQYYLCEFLHSLAKRALKRKINRQTIFRSSAGL